MWVLDEGLGFRGYGGLWPWVFGSAVFCSVAFIVSFEILLGSADFEGLVKLLQRLSVKSYWICVCTYYVCIFI